MLYINNYNKSNTHLISYYNLPNISYNSYNAYRLYLYLLNYLVILSINYLYN